MNKSKIIKWVLLAIPLFLITKCGIEGVLYTTNKTPTINPHPKEKLRIYGKFPFEKNVILEIQGSYSLQNPKCQDAYYVYGLGWLMHDNSRSTYVSVKAERTTDGNYEAVLYKDYYKPGFCDWKITGFTASMVQKGFVSNRVGSIYTSFTDKNVLHQDSTFKCGTIIKKDSDGSIFENTICGRKGPLLNPSSDSSRDDFSRNSNVWMPNNGLNIHSTKKEIEINLINKGIVRDLFDLEK